MNNLIGKRILVTGASSGIGRAVSQHAASLGASLILFGRNIQRLEETFQSLQGNDHDYYSVDVTAYPKVEEIIRSTVANGRQISGFVYSAGIERTIPLKGSTPLVFKEIFETNVFAAFEIARIISQKGIVDPKGASFLFLSSVLGRLGSPGNIVYCSSKSALLSGVKSMALELAPKKIRCNCILPGIVETEMIKKSFESIPPEAKEKIINKYPLGLGNPSDVAALVSFLLSDKARWITGGEYVIDGGYSAQ
jgi:NAD(P)-dependent dehydrogenase (short-subunit alcohol dehydrogenase family)